MSALMFSLLLICPVCAKEGEKSTVTVGASWTTLVAPYQFYDEEGHLHYSDPNTTTTQYKCSRGHEFTNHDLKEATNDQAKE